MDRFIVDEGDHLKGKESAIKLGSNHFQKADFVNRVIVYLTATFFSPLMGS